MVSKDLRVWLVKHDMTQTQLACKLGLSTRTVNTYCTGKPPGWMEYALTGLEIELNKAD